MANYYVTHALVHRVARLIDDEVARIRLAHGVPGTEEWRRDAAPDEVELHRELLRFRDVLVRAPRR